LVRQPIKVAVLSAVDISGEWNITKAAAERKAAFLNSFPIILDDTMKVDETN
jgi:hypothetical protein